MSSGGTWASGTVRFSDAQAFAVELEQFLSKGALRMGGDGLPEPLVPFDFELLAPGAAPIRLRGMIVSLARGLALVQLLDFSAEVTERIRRATLPPPVAAFPPPTSPPAQALPTGPPLTARTGVFAVQAPPLTEPVTGTITNPTTLADLSTLPLGTIGAVLDLRDVSLVGLTRHLGVRRATGLLCVVAPTGNRRVELERGAFLLSPQEREQFRAAFAWPKATFEFVPQPIVRAPHRMPVAAFRLVLDAIKAQIRELAPAELAASLEPGACVRLTSTFAERAPSLDLVPAEARTAQRDFDGRLNLREIARLGAISELNLHRLVTLLSLLGLVELVTPEPTASTGGATDPLRDEYDRLAAADLFTVLGLHWSDAPDGAAAGLAALRQRCAGSSSPYAAKLIELGERAHRRLADRAGRRAYREELGVNARHAAELLVEQVPLAKARGEYRKAETLLRAACDLYDKPEWQRLLAELPERRPTTTPPSFSPPTKPPAPKK